MREGKTGKRRWTWERGGGTWEGWGETREGTWERSKGRLRKAQQKRVVVQGKPAGEVRRWEENGANERGRDKGVK